MLYHSNFIADEARCTQARTMRTRTANMQRPANDKGSENHAVEVESQLIIRVNAQLDSTVAFVSSFAARTLFRLDW
jgi:hypothetical protein